MRKVFFRVGMGEGWEIVIRIRIREVSGATVCEGLLKVSTSFRLKYNTL